MQLSDHSLRQIDEAYLERLGEESLRSLSSKLLLDLKEARERLNQTSRNSSLPPSREAPWNKPGREDAATEGDGNPEETVSEVATAEAARDAEAKAGPAPAVESQPMARKQAGKVPGAPGYGRPCTGTGGRGGNTQAGGVRGVRGGFGGASRAGLHGVLRSGLGPGRIRLDGSYHQAPV